MSVGSGKILTITKGNKQMEIKVGDVYTTAKSNVKGIIKAIDNHPSGTMRVLLDVNGTERWTSVSAN